MRVAVAKVALTLFFVQLLSLDTNGSTTWLSYKLQKRRRNSRLPPPIVPTNKIQPKSLKKCLTCPAPRDSKLKRLMRKIGHVNPKYLSISKPSVLIPKVEQFQLSMVTTSQRKLIKGLLQEHTLPRYSNHVSHKIEKLLLRWLLRRSFCPLEYKWKDLGSLFWPRWIKIAKCFGKPCSWPNGMSCVPSSRTLVSLLWWHCRPRIKKRNGKKHRNGLSEKYACRWLKIKYPVVTRCSCACVNQQE